MSYAAWILALGFATWMFSQWLDTQNNPNRELRSTTRADTVEVVLQRNRYGHYRAGGMINGNPVEFMLDTGATTVAIPANVARRLNLQKGPPITVITANGTVTAYLTRLNKVQLGAITLRDVKANINPYMEGEEILLGMSFLKHLDFAQRDDTLIIKQGTR